MVCKFRSDCAQIHLDFIKTIRIRQMAVATEKNYEHWICRFMQFLNWPEIDSLGNSQIQAYLEHLGVNRKVTLSTRKVALNALIFLFEKCLVRRLVQLVHIPRLVLNRWYGHCLDRRGIKVPKMSVQCSFIQLIRGSTHEQDYRIRHSRNREFIILADESVHHIVIVMRSLVCFRYIKDCS